MEKLSVEELEELREKELDERAERDERIKNTISRIKNTISLIRKLVCVLLVITVSLMFFYVRKDYNNYAGSQLVMAEVIGVEDASDENIKDEPEETTEEKMKRISEAVKKHPKNFEAANKIQLGKYYAFAKPFDKISRRMMLVALITHRLRRIRYIYSGTEPVTARYHQISIVVS